VYLRARGLSSSPMVDDGFAQATYEDLVTAAEAVGYAKHHPALDEPNGELVVARKEEARARAELELVMENKLTQLVPEHSEKLVLASQRVRELAAKAGGTKPQDDPLVLARREEATAREALAFAAKIWNGDNDTHVWARASYETDLTNAQARVRALETGAVR
jgi:hypothetical protein